MPMPQMHLDVRLERGLVIVTVDRTPGKDKPVPSAREETLPAEPKDRREP